MTFEPFLYNIRQQRMHVKWEETIILFGPIVITLLGCMVDDLKTVRISWIKKLCFG